ncbi:MAG: hypothetical protein RL145_1616 [Pseudomonadota bacterium]|jgi:hypothetical protein
MEFALTRRQVARGTRPDVEINNKLYLIKNVSELRATYQIRLLLYRAMQERTKLVLDIPKSCKFSKPLMALVKEHRRHLEVTRS